MLSNENGTSTNHISVTEKETAFTEVLISEKSALAILNNLKIRFGFVNITRKHIYRISYEYLAPLLDVLESTVEDLKDAHETFVELIKLTLIPLDLDNAKRHYDISDPYVVFFDPELEDDVCKILKKYNPDMDKNELEDIVELISPIIFKLVYHYRLNKEISDLDLDLFDFNLSQLLNKDEIEGKDPTDDEIETIFFGCLNFKLKKIEVMRSFEKNVEASLFESIKCGFSDVVELIIDKTKIDPNFSIDEKTLFQHACEYGELDCVRALIKKGVNLKTLEDKYRFLYLASHYGHTESVKFLLSQNDSKNFIDLEMNNGSTPFIAACESGHLGIAQLLLNQGARLTKTMNNNATGLYLATQNGHMGIVEFLFSQEGIEKIIDLHSTTGHTPIMMACQKGEVGITQLFLREGAKLPNKRPDGYTFLYLSSMLGRIEMVDLLLNQNGVEDVINFPENDGYTPVMIACQQGFLETTQLLLNKGAQLTVITPQKVNGLYLACQNGYTEIVEHLLFQKETKDIIELPVTVNEYDGWTPLIVASCNGHLEIVKLLLSNDVNIFQKNSGGDTAIDIANKNGHTEILSLLVSHRKLKIKKLCIPSKRNDVEALRNIIEKQPGIDVNIPFEKGCNALHYAAQSWSIEALFFLIKQGGNKDYPTESNKTPLGILEATELTKTKEQKFRSLYTSCQKGEDDIFNYLTGKEIIKDIINLQTEDEETALMAACENGHFTYVKILIEKGAELRTTTSKGFTGLYLACENGHTTIVEFLLSQHDIQDIIDLPIDDGSTPFIVACQNGHLETAKLLLNKGAKLITTTPEGFTGLYLACENHHTTTVEFLLLQDDIKNIIDLPTNIGLTPFITACLHGHLEIVKLLTNKSAKLITTTPEGFTGLYLASLDGHTEVVEFLLSQNDIKKVINLPTSDEWTPLMAACMNGHLKIAKLLLNKDAQLTTKTSDCFTALYLACNGGYTTIVEFLLSQNDIKEILDLLADTESTPLMIACLHGHLEIVKLLLKNDVNIFHKNGDGDTAIDVANKNGYTEISSLLVFHKNLKIKELCIAAGKNNVEALKNLFEKQPGIDVNTPFKKGWNALHYAARAWSIEALFFLIEQGGDKDRPADNNKTAFSLLEDTKLTKTKREKFTRLCKSCQNNEIATLNYLVDQRIIEDIINLQTEDGKTPLMLACQNGYFTHVNILIEKGAQLAAITPGGITCLYLACENGYSEIVDFLLFGKGIEDIINISHNQVTPLMIACQKGYDPEIIKKMLEKGANVSWKNNNGITALEFANIMRNPVVIALLTTYQKAQTEALQKDSHVNILEKQNHEKVNLSAAEMDSDTTIDSNIVNAFSSIPLDETCGKSLKKKDDEEKHENVNSLSIDRDKLALFENYRRIHDERYLNARFNTTIFSSSTSASSSTTPNGISEKLQISCATTNANGTNDSSSSSSKPTNSIPTQPKTKQTSSTLFNPTASSAAKAVTKSAAGVTGNSNANRAPSSRTAAKTTWK